ncbi:MAG: hypothetical protein V3V08_07650 [Nannocystaceae bacterium]
MTALVCDPPRLVSQLRTSFCEQVARALDWELDGTTTSLAVADHYLSLARDEVREPILTLLAVGAGAYFGEIVRSTMGALWLSDGQNAHRLRLLLEPQFLHFAPVDLAFEAIIADTPQPDDPRLAQAVPFDASFQILRPPSPSEARSGETASPDDASWVDTRLSELAPVPQAQYYSLTGRYETLELIIELLATRHQAEGRRPRAYTLEDYIEALNG